MSSFEFFAPCPRGLEEALAAELHELGHVAPLAVGAQVPGGVHFAGSWAAGMAANLHSRIASRVLLRIAQRAYRSEQDIYALAMEQRWEDWFSARQTLRVDVTAIKAPLKSLEFVTLRIKDAICDRLRDKTGARPSIDTAQPDVRAFAFLSAQQATLYLDTSGDALFKRGWRLDKGAAPLRENLAAGILRLAGWRHGMEPAVPLYDPMCGSGTFLAEAAQISLGVPAGVMRRFGFERLQGYDINAWQGLKQQALDAQQAARAHGAPLPIYGSDISGDMLIKARLNFERAGLPPLSLKQIDARAMVPPCAEAGIIVTNPPYGERLEVRGRGAGRRDDDGADLDDEYGDSGFRRARPDNVDAEFFQAFGNALKQRFAGWTVHVLTADMRLPGQMRLREARRTPLFNGAIECRLFRFDMIAGAVRKRPAPGSSDPAPESA
ncbi:MAG: class I SAM-dependent RNA methyltransferase [Burkholderiales bacterium]|nr:class I SAM-dependent RNA methyltransferase [Burkholderiales bacterium]